MTSYSMLFYCSGCFRCTSATFGVFSSTFGPVYGQGFEKQDVFEGIWLSRALARSSFSYA